jgi:hypothetical protein
LTSELISFVNPIVILSANTYPRDDTCILLVSPPWMLNQGIHLDPFQSL